MRPAEKAKKAKDAKPRASSAAAPSTVPEASAGAAATDPVPALVEHAEKLMAARRFKDAATAYRELLRRFPNHAAVPSWRKRLATAEAADAATFAAPPP